MYMFPRTITQTDLGNKQQSTAVFFVLYVHACGQPLTSQSCCLTSLQDMGWRGHLAQAPLPLPMG